MISRVRQGFLDQVRKAVKSSGMSLYDLSRQCQVDRAALSRFAAGKAGLSMESLDKLADALDLMVVERPRGNDKT